MLLMLYCMYMEVQNFEAVFVMSCSLCWSLKQEHFILPGQHWSCYVAKVARHPCGTWLGFHVVFFHCHTKKQRIEKDRWYHCSPLSGPTMNCVLTMMFYIYTAFGADDNLFFVCPFHQGRPNNLFVWGENFNPRAFPEVWKRAVWQTRQQI